MFFGIVIKFASIFSAFTPDGYIVWLSPKIEQGESMSASEDEFQKIQEWLVKGAG